MRHTSRQARRNTRTRAQGETDQTAGRSGSGPHRTWGHDLGGRWGAIPYILVVWCVSRVILTGIGVGAIHWIGELPDDGNVLHATAVPNETVGIWLAIWNSWDSYWYYHIADVGYLATPVSAAGHSAWVFFPLYPWVARAVAAVVGDLYIAALLVSNASLLIGAWALYKLVQHRYDDARARKAVLFLFLFPTAYVFSCLLTEGLFLALTIGAWYCAKRCRWILASVLGMASTMTRMVGLFMAPLLALEYLRQRQWHLTRVRPDALWIGLVPIGLVVFMATCYTLTGNPWEFSDVQDVWGARGNPLGTLWWSLEEAWEGRFALKGGRLAFGYGYGSIATIVAIGVLLWGRKQIGTLLCLWSLAVILISLSAHHIVSAASMPRYLASIFPLFMILASLRTKSVTFVIIVAVLSLLQAATFSLWTLGYRVAV